MSNNRYLEIKDAIDAARQRLSLIRQGILPGDDAKWMPRSYAPKVRVHGLSQPSVQRKGASVPFHIPATRSHRLANATGATSFHFSHRSISKVTFATCQEGVRVKPGAARAHGRYVEREDAVALLDPAVESEIFSEALGATVVLPLTRSNQEHCNHDYTYDHQIDQWLGRGLVDDISTSEPGLTGPPFTGPNLGRPVEDSLADAGVWLLPRCDVVRHGSATHGLLRSSSDVSVETWADPLGLRQPSKGNRDKGTRLDTPSLRGFGDAAGHDNYIGRRGAVAIQPDGTRALLTNIDASAAERALFWSSVEECESVSRGDRMSLRLADNPDFWSCAAAQEDCPPELKAMIATAAAEKTVRFDISSGEEMRAFLATRPGWVSPSKKGKTKGECKPFAKFHDGRSGRVQYRIVGELPNELDEVGRFGIMREFCEEFTKRGLPFVAVMHAPDSKNDERNWHFHLIYYDRPCRRITSDDISDLATQGYRTRDLQPGMWDFEVVTPKKGRSNGKAVPLTQNKVLEVTTDQWIPRLRKRLSEITNAHLANAGVTRRVDPRRYEEMGIVADPQEHLGTNQAAAETRGEATFVGCENECRQWAAIMAEADSHLELALVRVDEQVKARPATEEVGAEDPTRKREQLAEAARLEHMAYCLEQDIDRARSRAAAVSRKNRQLLDAYDADPAAGTVRERAQATQLVDAATSYLAALEDALGDDVALPDVARASATQIRAAVTSTNAADVRKEDTGQERHPPSQGDDQKSSNGVPPSNGQPSNDHSVRQLEASNAARQAAIAAASRGQGR